MSESQILRLAISDGLADYLGAVQYVDPNDARTMRDAIVKCGNAISQIALELRRIGVNYNQAVKLEHIREREERIQRIWKRGNINDKMSLMSESKELEQEKNKILNGETAFTVDQIEKLMARYEAATGEVSKLLWHTQA